MKILLPVDGSDASRNAIRQAMVYARALNAKVIGLNVVPEFHMPRDEGDLIVMASHGHAGPTAVLLGSETAKVLTHTKLPVLVLR